MKEKWILLRGLTRGNEHWGDFPEKLKREEVEIELHEIPGNGTLNEQLTPTDAKEVILQIKEKSNFIKNKYKVQLCGISLGGMIALKWAELFPDELQSIYIINSSLPQLSPFYKRLIPNSYGRLIKALLNRNFYSREEIILKLTSNSPDRASLFVAKFSEFSKRFPPHRNNFYRQLLLANNIFIKFPLKVPSHVICSDCDRLVSYECSIKLSEKLNIKPSVHPWAGHDLPLDDPEWLVNVLTQKA